VRLAALDTPYKNNPQSSHLAWPSVLAILTNSRPRIRTEKEKDPLFLAAWSREGRMGMPD
jgi:hypothetical protein